MINKIKAILKILYLLVIPVIYCQTMTSALQFVSPSFAILLGQLVGLTFMIPHFLFNIKKYNKVDSNIIKECIVIFFMLQGMFYFSMISMQHNSITFKLLNPLLYVLCGVVGAPLVEELYFRGMLVDSLSSLPTKVVTVLTALSFSLVHIIRGYNIAQLIVLFLLGLKLKTLRDKHKNILPSITLHSTWNYLCLTMLKF